MDSSDITKLKSQLFLKYQHIIENGNASIEDMVEQIVDYYESVIRCMPGNVYLFDKHLASVACNQNVLDMLGYKSIEEFKQKTFEDMGKDGGWPKKSEQSFKADTLKVIKTKQPKLNVEEPPIPGKSRQMTHFLSSRVPLFDRSGNVSGVVGISINITDRKNMELELKNALKAAQAASESKTEFIRNISHDLRTPLAGIIGMADIIYHDPHNKITKEGTYDIRQAGVSLLNLLNEIIETTQIESGNMIHKKSCFSLKNTLTSLTSIFKPSIKQKKLKLETYYDDNIPDILYGEELLLHRIILNLLGNAVKFTDKGSISLEASLLQKRSNIISLKIVVKDTGIGIPLDKQKIIFEKFSRLNPSYNNQYKGSGLGLFMVKQFIEKLGGDIQVSSTLGAGSQFTCIIQFQVPTNVQLNKFETMTKKNAILLPHTMFPSSTNSKKFQVLLVEDTPLPLKIAENLLNKENSNVVTAITAQEAFEKSQQQVFDIIYMDIGLPDSSGIDVVRDIRKDAKNPNRKTFIAMLTAHSDAAIKKACLDAGAQDVLEKPLSIEKIININRFLSAEQNKTSIEQQSSIDIASTAQLMGNNIELAKEATNAFLNALPEYRNNIVHAFEAKDWKKLQQYVHQLHGDLCYIEATRLKNSVETLEQALRACSGQYNEPYQALIQEMGRVIGGKL